MLVVGVNYADEFWFMHRVNTHNSFVMRLLLPGFWRIARLFRAMFSCGVVFKWSTTVLFLGKYSCFEYIFVLLIVYVEVFVWQNFADQFTSTFMMVDAIAVL